MLKILKEKNMENLDVTIISFFFEPPAGTWFFILRLVFLIISAVLFGAIIFCLMKSSWLKYYFLDDAVEFLSFRPFGLKKIEKQWLRIKKRMDLGLESEYKLALIGADNMMADTLKRMGCSGETLEEKLKGVTAATLPNIEEIKTVHQVRNNIIHDPDYRLSLEETRNAMEVYEKAFRDLQAF